MVVMGDFDEFVKPSAVEVPEAPKPRTEATSKAGGGSEKSKGSSKKVKGKSLAEMLMGDEQNPAVFADRMGLDAEMTEKVLVPLLNFLDKYEIGSGIGESPTAQGVMDIGSVVADVAPVIKNAAEYFSGRTQKLGADDEAFLAKIREANEGGMDLFFTEDEVSIGEAVGPEEPAAPAQPAYSGPIPLDSNPFANGVDWAAALSGPEYQTKDTSISATYTEMMPKPDLMIKGLEALAAESGLDPKKVMASDTQAKINRNGSQGSAAENALAAGSAAGLDLGLDSIKAEMNKEKNKQAATSKVQFDNGDLMVPSNVDSYDPLNVPGFTLPPTPLAGLETVDEMANRVGVDLENYEAEETPMEEITEEVEDEPIFELESTESEEITEDEFYGSINFGDEDE